MVKTNLTEEQQRGRHSSERISCMRDFAHRFFDYLECLDITTEQFIEMTGITKDELIEYLEGKTILWESHYKALKKYYFFDNSEIKYVYYKEKQWK